MEYTVKNFKFCLKELIYVNNEYELLEYVKDYFKTGIDNIIITRTEYLGINTPGFLYSVGSDDKHGLVGLYKTINGMVTHIVIYKCSIFNVGKFNEFCQYLFYSKDIPKEFIQGLVISDRGYKEEISFLINYGISGTSCIYKYKEISFYLHKPYQFLWTIMYRRRIRVIECNSLICSISHIMKLFYNVTVDSKQILSELGSVLENNLSNIQKTSYTYNRKPRSNINEITVIDKNSGDKSVYELNKVGVIEKIHDTREESKKKPSINGFNDSMLDDFILTHDGLDEIVNGYGDICGLDDMREIVLGSDGLYGVENGL